MPNDFQEKCPKCDRVITANSENTLKIDMAEHLNKHEIEAKKQVAFEALPQVVEQAKKDAPEIIHDEIATVIDKWFDANYVYVRVRSSSGSETVMTYDPATKRLVDHTEA
jgi:hypothetical protein